MTPITQESMELLKGALAKPNDVLAKSISTATGLLAYDLQAPAKNLYPFVTPIRNVMPRVGGGTGSATNWRQAEIIGSRCCAASCRSWSRRLKNNPSSIRTSASVCLCASSVNACANSSALVAFTTWIF